MATTLQKWPLNLQPTIFDVNTLLLSLFNDGGGLQSLAKEPCDLFESMMTGNVVDTIWRGTSPKGFLFQYNGSKYPRLKNRTFINSDVNWILSLKIHFPAAKSSFYRQFLTMTKGNI